MYEPQKIEKEILEFWEREKIPQKVVEFDRKKPKFYVLDGPPYLTNVPHVGNVRATINKDVISRFKQMRGFSVWYQPGFDTHGLPIEVKVEEKLNIKSKHEIEKNTDKFIRECQKFTDSGLHTWLELYKKIGTFRGWVEPYITKKPEYIESSWWTLKKLYENNLLVKGSRPVAWCPRCGTALAGYEVTDSYKDLTDPSIYVKFKIKDKNEYLLVWTTTPWTLTANVAIVAHPDEYYVKIEVNGEKLILAEKLLENVVKEIGIKKYKILEKFKGSELDQIEYCPIIECEQQEELKKNRKAHKVYLSIPILKQKASGKHVKGTESEVIDFSHMVTMDMGTGLVHCAPGHGDVDAKIGKYYGLPEVSPIDDKCRYTKKVSRWEGIDVKRANEMIIDYLKNKNSLFYASKIIHSCAVCWRCKTPLITRLSEQWFIAVTKIKDRMINKIEKIFWKPESAKIQFKNWVEESEDWALSRDRFWGIPIPIWICEKCKKEKIIGSVKELRENSAKKLPEKLDLHINTIRKIEFKCECGGKMKNISKVVDVWFDSGAAAWASLHYPIKKEKYEVLGVPDYISENEDQIRGWFYSQMILSTAVFDKLPYKSVLMARFVLDEKGEKMSKSIGNVIDPFDIIRDYGADPYRIYMFKIDVRDRVNFNKKILSESTRDLIIIDNSLNFYNTYCKKMGELKNLGPEDEYILSKLNSLILNVTNYLEKYEIHLAVRNLIDFGVNELSRTYIRLIRNDIKNESGKVAAVLNTIFENYIKLIAPFAPFFAEYLWRKFNKEDEGSIHLQKWPKHGKINGKIEKQMDIIKKIIEASNAMRQEKKIKLRYPLLSLTVSGNKDVLESVKNLSEIVKKMANVKEVKISKIEPKYVVKPNYATLGKKFGKDIKKIVKELEERDADKLKREIEKKGETKIMGFVLKKDDLIFSEKSVGGKEFDGGVINLDFKVTEKLKNEWLVRELIRAVQEKRKNLKLKIEDKIRLYLPTDFKKFENIIERDTGSKIIFGKLSGRKSSFVFEKKEYEFGVEI